MFPEHGEAADLQWIRVSDDGSQFGGTQRGQDSLFWLRPLVDSCLGYYAGEITLPRPSRADEAGVLYHALNRGNLCAEIFHKDEDFAAFERILHEGLQLHQVQLYSYQLIHITITWFCARWLTAN
jgi:hypothetical protein